MPKEPTVSSELAPSNADMFVRLYDQLRAVGQELLTFDKSRSVGGTDLVDLAAIKLLQAGTYPSVAAFHQAAVRTMRNIIVDRARARRSIKRGGSWKRIETDSIDIYASGSINSTDWGDALAALQRLRMDFPDEASVIELDLLGRTRGQIADALGVSVACVRRAQTDAKRRLKTWLEERRP